MKTNRSSTNWLIDAALFLIFIALFFLELTGLALHQWLGLAAGALALYHLARHGEWVKAVSRRLFGRTTGSACRCYVVDAALLLGLGAILVSGLLISTWFSVSLGGAAAAWASFHVTASRATLVLIVVKLAFHWRWIVGTARHLFPQSAAPAVGQPVAAASGMTRRDFLKVIGAVSATAALAMFHNIEPTTTVSAQTPSVQSAAAAPSESSALPCTASCPKGRHCSYPGSCRSYTDANNNGLCDLGECS